MFASFLALASPVLADALLEPIALTGETRITALGSHYDRFVLDRPARLERFDLEAAEDAYGMLYGSVTPWVLETDGVPLGFRPGDTLDLPPGSYFVYLVTPSKSPIVATLGMNLSGTSEHTLRHVTRSYFGDLHPDPLLSTGTGAGLLRFHGAQPFPAEAHTGMLVKHRTTIDVVEEHEMRWSTDAGVTWCWAWGSKGFTPATREVAVSVDDASHGGPVTLTYFRTTLNAASETSAKGFWIERAPDDPPRYHHPIATTPAWDTPLRDVDARCAHQAAGAALASTPLASS